MLRNPIETERWDEAGGDEDRQIKAVYAEDSSPVFSSRCFSAGVSWLMCFPGNTVHVTALVSFWSDFPLSGLCGAARHHHTKARRAALLLTHRALLMIEGHFQTLRAK